MSGHFPTMKSVPYGALKEISSIEIYGIGLPLADLSRLVDQSRETTVTLILRRLLLGASVSVDVGLIKATVDVIGVQNGQVE